MSGLLAQLLRLGLALAFNPARLAEGAADTTRRMTILLVCGLMAGVILLPAIGCGAAGVWIFVQERLGPVWAALITAAALVLVAVIVLLIGLIASRKPRHRRYERPEREDHPGTSPLDTAATMLPALVALLAMPKKAASAGAAAGRGFFSRHKGTILLGAGIAGLVFGQDLFRPGRRRNRDSK
jgi:hypothetical protein